MIHAIQLVRPTSIVRENVRDTAKNVKSHDFLDFEKNVKKNVKKRRRITYRPTGLKTAVTTLSQFCCPSNAQYQSQYILIKK